jgi:hypothetical protein
MIYYLGFSLAISSILLTIIGFIMILWKAFARGIWWGIGCILLPPITIVFVILNWQESKKDFVVFIIGAILSCGMAYLFMQETEKAISKIKSQKITITTGLDNTNLPISDLAQVSINEKIIFLHTRLEVPPGIKYVFIGRIYDANDKLVFDNKLQVTPRESVWNVWFYYSFNKSKDTPGLWRFELLANDTKLAEKSFNVTIF